MPRTLSGSARGPLWPCIASGRRWDLPAASPGSCRASKVSSCAARHRRGLPSGVRPAGFSSPCWFLWGVSSPSPIAMLLRTLARPAPGGRLPNHRPGGPATSRERGPVGSCCVSCCFLLLTNIGGRAPCVKPTMIRFRSLTCNDAAFEKKSKILYAERARPGDPRAGPSVVLLSATRRRRARWCCRPSARATCGGAGGRTQLQRQGAPAMRPCPHRGTHPALCCRSGSGNHRHP